MLLLNIEMMSCENRLPFKVALEWEVIDASIYTMRLFWGRILTQLPVQLLSKNNVL